MFLHTLSLSLPSSSQVELIEPFLTSLHKHPVPDLSTETIMSIVPEGITTGQVDTSNNSTIIVPLLLPYLVYVIIMMT